MKLEVLVHKAENKKSHIPLVFIHGAAGGAWYFESFLSYFSNKGFDCYAFSLRGHGKSDGYDELNTFGLDDYVDDLKSVINRLEEKPIVIGHSMGGAIVQKYLSKDQDHLAGALLLASAEAGGISDDSPLGLFFSDSRGFLRSMRQMYPNQDLSLETLINETIFSNRFSTQELKEIRLKLTKESSKVKKDLLKPFMTGNEKIKIPIYVIGSLGDHIVTKDKTEKTAKAFGVEPIFIDDLCHFMTIDPDWEKAAEAILSCVSNLI
ncbi:MAG: alpha/beta hydrolase [Firmicutes bacterium]|nr:alpha/beta hydrolase [Bacillota bacterium]